MTKGGIFPPALSPELLGDSRRRAEIQVYERLRDQLQGFTVFYHCQWYDETSSHNSRDGEADFIVAHPKWGFVVLEVKGGVISRDELTRRWSSRNRQGQVFEIKNPVEQALVSKHVILRKLLSSWANKAPFIRAKHGVIFPDSGRPHGLDMLGADMPVEIFAFAEDMDELGARVVQILVAEPEQSNTQYDAMGKQGIEILHDLFDRGFELNISLASILTDDDKKIVDLTDQQNSHLDLTANQRRAVFTGGAGTGKTTLAIEKSKRLASDGGEVLLLCFNNALATHLQSQLADVENITVSSFHQFCRSAAMRAGVTWERKAEKDPRTFFEDVLPDALLEALSANDDLSFDAIIVDEGQDFLMNWWEPLLLALKRTDGTFFVFRDDNQKIYGERPVQVPSLSVDSLHLSMNFRNTQTIFRAAEKYYAGERILAGGPIGKDIEWCPTKPGREVQSVEKVINRLVNIDGIPVADIAVLCACAANKSAFGSDGWLGRYETARAEDVSGHAIRFDSIHRFKGLESKIVILTDMDGAIASTELMYVGLTRARLLLIVAASDSTIDKLKRDIEE